MSSSIIILPFFLFCFLCFPHFIASAANCRNNKCSKDEPSVGFPFRLKGRQGKTCGYPGFDLTCDNMNRTVLELPFSEPFFVREINYYSTYDDEIKLQDPDNCLTRRFLNKLNLSGTPFIIRFTDYSFFNCSSNVSYLAPIIAYSMTRISCLSSSTHTFFAASPSSEHGSLFERYCSLIATVPVPVEHFDSRMHPYQSRDESILHLTWEWNESNCKIKCHKTNDGKGNKVVLISIGIIATIIIAWYIICKCYFNPNRNSTSRDVSSGAIRTTPPSVVTTVLDGSAIQYFRTVVLGESGRLPNPHISNCAICLADYQPKEILKTLPACIHSFHADCIDVWLHLKSTCPVCRTFPVP